MICNLTSKFEQLTCFVCCFLFHNFLICLFSSSINTQGTATSISKSENSPLNCNYVNSLAIFSYSSTRILRYSHWPPTAAFSPPSCWQTFCCSRHCNSWGKFYFTLPTAKTKYSSRCKYNQADRVWFDHPDNHSQLLKDQCCLPLHERCCLWLQKWSHPHHFHPFLYLHLPLKIFFHCSDCSSSIIIIINWIILTTIHNYWKISAVYFHMSDAAFDFKSEAILIISILFCICISLLKIFLLCSDSSSSSSSSINIKRIPFVAIKAAASFSCCLFFIFFLPPCALITLTSQNLWNMGKVVTMDSVFTVSKV